MRIVDVSAFYTPHGGGVRTYVEHKLHVSRGLGHKMIVVVPGERNEIVEHESGGILHMVESPLFPLDRRYRYFADERALHTVLDSWAPDFVEASSPWSSAAMVARWRGSAGRALVMHADPLAAYAYRWFGAVASIGVIDRGFGRYWDHLRRLDRAFDHIVVASGNLATRLRDGGLRNVTTIPMGVEPGLFSPSHRDPALRRRLLESCGLSEDARLLLGIGRYSAEKRWGMVIDAADATSNVGLVLIGQGRQRDRLIAKAAKTSHVAIADAVGERTQLAAIMASADGLVHGCEAETFCMVAAEARASGLPIIVPDRGGAADHAGIGDYRYVAANRQSLQDMVAAWSSDRPRPAIKPAVRTMDDHFLDLFYCYQSMAIRSAA